MQDTLIRQQLENYRRDFQALRTALSDLRETIDEERIPEPSAVHAFQQQHAQALLLYDALFRLLSDKPNDESQRLSLDELEARIAQTEAENNLRERRETAQQALREYLCVLAISEEHAALLADSQREARELLQALESAESIDEGFAALLDRTQPFVCLLACIRCTEPAIPDALLDQLAAFDIPVRLYRALEKRSFTMQAVAVPQSASPSIQPAPRSEPCTYVAPETGDKPEEPSEAPEPSEARYIPAPENAGPLPLLQIEIPPYRKFSPSVFSKDLQAINAKAACLFYSLTSYFEVFSSDMLVAMMVLFNVTHFDRAPTARLQAHARDHIELLCRKGYFARITLDEQVLFTHSAAGKEVFEKKSSLDRLKASSIYPAMLTGRDWTKADGFALRDQFRRGLHFIRLLVCIEEHSARANYSQLTSKLRKTGLLYLFTLQNIGKLTEAIPCVLFGQFDLYNADVLRELEACLRADSTRTVFSIVETEDLEAALLPFMERLPCAQGRVLLAHKNEDSLLVRMPDGEIHSIPRFGSDAPDPGEAKRAQAAQESDAQTNEATLQPVPATQALREPVQAQSEAAIAQSAQTVPGDARVTVNAQTLAQNLRYAPEDRPRLAALCIRLLAENRIHSAVLLAKTLSWLPDAPDFQHGYQRLLLATGLPLDAVQYTSQALHDVFEHRWTEESGEAFLYVAALARTLLAPDRIHDYGLPTRAAFFEQYDPIFDSYALSALKQVFVLLYTLLALSPKGFTPGLLASFRTEEERTAEVNAIRSAASEFSSTPMGKSRFAGYPEFLKLAFGPGSDFCLCMETIARGEKEQNECIEKLLNRFVQKSGGESAFSAEEIARFINEQWDAVRVQLRHTEKRSIDDKLLGKTRNTVLNIVQRRLELMQRWVNMDMPVPDAQLQNLRCDLIQALRDAATQCERAYVRMQPQSVSAGLAVVAHRMRELQRVLEQNNATRDPWLFIDFLRGCYIGLDSERMPALDPDFQQVAGYEPWRLVVAQIAEEACDFAEALRRIDDPQARHWFRNYASAQWISQYCAERFGEEAMDYSASFDQTAWYTDASAELEGALELAYMYGRISESSKEALLHSNARFRSDFAQSNDLGRYIAFLDALKRQMREESARIGKELTQRFESLDVSQAHHLAVQVERLLQDENYTLAEEMINRIDSGETSFSTDEYEPEADRHADFLRFLDRWYDKCQQQQYKANPPFRWAYDLLRIEEIPAWTKNAKNSAQNLIADWPYQRGLAQLPQLVQRVFQNLGFDVKGAKLLPSVHNVDHCLLTMQPALRNQPSYAHPIPLFGTELNTLDVLCFFGRIPAVSLCRTMQGLRTNHTTVVLMDYALELSERRRLAEELKKECIPSFIMIDRMLLFYLATLDRGMRLSALLKCTLPYTYYQPFSSDSGIVADEMFFGRSLELSEVINKNGTSLVYGGRQLGKTALLMRARSRMHIPEEQCYALRIDANKQGEVGAVQRIVTELGYLQLPIEACTSFAALCDQLRTLWNENAIRQLCLLIDEADTLLLEAQENGFKALEPLIHLRDEMRNDFRFVLAGLHNVLRTSRVYADNSVIAHMGQPLCIKPLLPSDAQRLLQTPLSYLGLTIDSNTQLPLILSHTNFYPGTLHFFGRTLIQSISKNYTRYFSYQKNPPCELLDQQLKEVLAQENLNQSVLGKIRMTLDLDIRYVTIATIIAHLYYKKRQSDEPIPNLRVEDIQEIGDQFADYGTRCLRGVTRTDYENLLLEMTEMGILCHLTEGYRLRKTSFLEAIGSPKDVDELLLEGAKAI